MIEQAVVHIWGVYLDTAFWLLFGLLVAGLIKGYVSEARMSRWLGGRGAGSVVRATMVGAPLPLCSCGVLPVALGLRRSGASKGATVSFLISTPETSVDSITVTYALMGPVMAVVRPIAALVSALVTGLMALFLPDDPGAEKLRAEDPNRSCCSTESDCCSGKAEEAESSCCSGTQPKKEAPAWLQGMRYTLTTMLDDISGWLIAGIVVAGLVAAFVPQDWLAQWGAGPWAMLAMVMVGIPMYVCATASTPIAAALMLAGVSPGAVLVFLLVGPATNFAGLAIIGRELGRKALVVYLAGLVASSVALGVLLDVALTGLDVDPVIQATETQGMLPAWLSWTAALILLFLVLRPVRRRVLGV